MSKAGFLPGVFYVMGSSPEAPFPQAGNRTPSWVRTDAWIRSPGARIHGPGEGLFPQVPIIRPEGYKDRAAPEGDLLHSEKISSRPVRLQASGPEHQPAGAVGNRRARHWSISREGDGLGDEFLGEEGNWTIKSTAGEPSPGNGSVYIHAVPEIIGASLLSGRRYTSFGVPVWTRRPENIRAIRSDMDRASSRSWVTRTTVIWNSRCN